MRHQKRNTSYKKRKNKRRTRKKKMKGGGRIVLDNNVWEFVYDNTQRVKLTPQQINQLQQHLANMGFRNQAENLGVLINAKLGSRGVVQDIGDEVPAQLQWISPPGMVVGSVAPGPALSDYQAQMQRLLGGFGGGIGTGPGAGPGVASRASGASGASGASATPLTTTGKKRSHSALEVYSEEAATRNGGEEQTTMMDQSTIFSHATREFAKANNVALPPSALRYNSVIEAFEGELGFLMDNTHDGFGGRSKSEKEGDESAKAEEKKSFFRLFENIFKRFTDWKESPDGIKRLTDLQQLAASDDDLPEQDNIDLRALRSFEFLMEHISEEGPGGLIDSKMKEHQLELLSKPFSDMKMISCCGFSRPIGLNIPNVRKRYERGILISSSFVKPARLKLLEMQEANRGGWGDVMIDPGTGVKDTRSLARACDALAPKIKSHFQQAMAEPEGVVIIGDFYEADGQLCADQAAFGLILSSDSITRIPSQPVTITHIPKMPQEVERDVLRRENERLRFMKENNNEAYKTIEKVWKAFELRHASTEDKKNIF